MRQNYKVDTYHGLKFGTIVVVEGYSKDWDGVGRVAKYGIRFFRVGKFYYGGFSKEYIRVPTNKEILSFKLLGQLDF